MATITIPRVIQGSDDDTSSRDIFQHIAGGLKFKERPVWGEACERSASLPQRRSNAAVVRDHQR